MISLTAKAAMYAQDTGEVFLILLTINHADLVSPLRFVNNTVNVTSNGDEYIAWPFELVLPDQSKDRDVVASLSIDNVSRDISQAIQLIQTSPTVGISVIRGDDPDTIELSLPTMVLREVSWDAFAIGGELSLLDNSNIVYPGGRFDPSGFPGLF